MHQGWIPVSSLPHCTVLPQEGHTFLPKGTKSVSSFNWQCSNTSLCAGCKAREFLLYTSEQWVLLYSSLGPNSTGQGLGPPPAYFRQVQDKFGGLQVCYPILPDCVVLQEKHYSSITFLPFLLLPDRFLGFLFLYHSVNNGTFFFNYSFGRRVLHMPWKPTLQSSFIIPKPFPFQPWLRATKLTPKGTLSVKSDPIQHRDAGYCGRRHREHDRAEEKGTLRWQRFKLAGKLCHFVVHYDLETLSQ